MHGMLRNWFNDITLGRSFWFLSMSLLFYSRFFLLLLYCDWMNEQAPAKCTILEMSKTGFSLVGDNKNLFYWFDGLGCGCSGCGSCNILIGGNNCPFHVYSTNLKVGFRLQMVHRNMPYQFQFCIRRKYIHLWHLHKNCCPKSISWPNCCYFHMKLAVNGIWLV